MFDRVNTSSKKDSKVLRNERQIERHPFDFNGGAQFLKSGSMKLMCNGTKIVELGDVGAEKEMLRFDRFVANLKAFSNL